MGTESQAMTPEAEGERVACPACGAPCAPSAEGTGGVTCSACGHTFDPGKLSTAAGAPGPFAEPFDVEPVLRPGTRFGGYEILELIGRGGMGRVYRAVQLSLGRTVALKVLDGRLARDPVFRERFERESQALTTLDHPNIVRIIDRGRDGEAYYFVMEIVVGSNLREWAANRQPSFREMCVVIQQLCDAVAYAHAQGIIHRDIKPENVLVDRFGAVKVTDFGLSRVLGHDGAAAGRLTQTRLVMGTFDYIAPEQRESAKSATPRSDIFALGVVIYEMLTGELPLGNFDPPSRTPGVPESLDEVVLRALHKDPERRYRRVADLRDAFCAAAKAAPTGARPLSTQSLTGAAPPAPPAAPGAWPLCRSRTDRRMAGVCGGIARWLGIQGIWVRLVFVLLFVAGNGLALIAYIALAILIPDERRLSQPLPQPLPAPQRGKRVKPPKPPKVRRRRTWWAWVAGFWAVSTAALVVVAAESGRIPGTNLDETCVAVMFAGAAALVSAMIGWAAIRRSQGALKGGVLCTLAFIVGAAAVLLAGMEIADGPRGPWTSGRVGPRLEIPYPRRMLPALPGSIPEGRFTPSPPPVAVLAPDLSFRYAFPEDADLHYRTFIDQRQYLSVESGPVEIRTERTLDFRLNAVEMDGGNQRLNVTVDAARMEIGLPDLTLTPDMGGVVGKSFEMTVSPLGEEVDISGAESLTYGSQAAPGERVSIASDFQALFPNLPGHGVHAGATWTTTDTLAIDGGGVPIVARLETQNTFEGYETIDGMTCARIRAETRGEFGGSGFDEGVPVTAKGTLQGTGSWYFAPDRGVFVRSESAAEVSGTITLGDPATTTIPLRQSVKYGTALVRE